VRFDQQFWLYLVPLMPLMWLILRASDRRARNRLAVLLGPRADRHVEGANPRLGTWRRFLFFAGIFWLLLALARPQWGASEVTVTQRASDIVVALDISNSMLAEDVPPNRMERAKAELRSFIGRLENSRVGLVFFAGAAFVQCPLTLDYGTAEIFLAMAGPDMMSQQGTAIGSALEASRALLAKGNEGRLDGGFQAILLVTDGEDLEGDWEKQAEACRDEGIRVIPVGVGDEKGGLIPAFDRQGREDGFMKDDQGNVVMTRLDLASLEKMAGISGGSTFRVGVDGLAGDRLFAELQRLGKRDLEEKRVSAYQERYVWPLLLAMVCFGLRLALRPRRDPRSPQAALTVGLVLLLIGAVSPAAAGVLPPGLEAAKAGREHYYAGRFPEALDSFREARIQAPDDPRISLALGETLHKLGRYPEAIAEFQRTLQLTDDQELRAEALYNAGTTQLAAGDPKTAGESLRSSLDLESGREDALYNLEVALLREMQQQQEQEQEQQEEQQEQDQEKQEGEDQQDQQPQENQEQQPDPENQEQQDQENQDQENQDQPPDQTPPEQQQEQPPQQTEPDESEQELTREQAEQILKALDRDEEELKQSVQKRLKGGRPKSGKKW